MPFGTCATFLVSFEGAIGAARRAGYVCHCVGVLGGKMEGEFHITKRKQKGSKIGYLHPSIIFAIVGRLPMGRLSPG